MEIKGSIFRVLTQLSLLLLLSILSITFLYTGIFTSEDARYILLLLGTPCALASIFFGFRIFRLVTFVLANKSFVSIDSSHITEHFELDVSIEITDIKQITIRRLTGNGSPPAEMIIKTFHKHKINRPNNTNAYRAKPKEYILFPVAYKGNRLKILESISHHLCSINPKIKTRDIGIWED